MYKKMSYKQQANNFNNKCHLMHNIFGLNMQTLLKDT